MKRLLAIACFSLLDVQNADKNGECRAGCKSDGYASGAYYRDTDLCWCANRRQMQLPNKRVRIKSDIAPYKETEEVKLPWE